MKTMKIFGILAVSFFMMAFTSSPDIKVRPNGEKAFTLFIDNTDGGKIDVILKDAEGKVLESDRIRKQESLSRVYNLENLPAGEYKLFVVDGAKTTSHTIVVSENDVRVPKNLKAEYFAPAIVVNDDNLDFTMLTLRESLVTIEIIHESGFKNYSVGTCENGSVQRRFDISELEPGMYTLKTHVEGQNFENVYYEAFTVGNAMAWR